MQNSGNIKYPIIRKSTGLTTIEYGNNKTGKSTYMTFLEHIYVQERKVIVEKIPKYKSGYYTVITGGGYHNTTIYGYTTSNYHSVLR